MYQNSSLAIQAEGYSSEVTIENLPEDSDDELIFGETFVNVPKQVSFNLVNHGTTPIRFEWKSSSPEFYFGPPVGHVSVCTWDTSL